MGELMTSEAAAILHVSTRQVGRLLASGQLERARTIGRSFTIDAASVQRCAQASRRRGRVWAEHTAWAALALMSGQEVDWLAASQLTRLKHRLRRMSVEEAANLARDRAKVRRYRAHSSVSGEIAGFVAATGGAALNDSTIAARFGLTAAENAVDGYLLDSHVVLLVDHFGLVSDPEGNATLRGLAHDRAFPGGRTPIAAVATDLMESLDTRERSAGARILQELLDG